MRALLAAVLMAAACGKPNEAVAWRDAKTVCVLVDTVSFYDRMKSAVASESNAAAMVDSAPPAYRLRQSGLMVYLKEEDVPPKTGYTLMTAHQAAATALTYPGSEGVCIDPTGPICTRSLDRTKTAALEAALRKDAGKPLPLELTIKDAPARS